MDLVLNNLQWLICHKNPTNQPTNQPTIHTDADTQIYMCPRLETCKYAYISMCTYTCILINSYVHFPKVRERDRQRDIFIERVVEEGKDMKLKEDVIFPQLIIDVS